MIRAMQPRVERTCPGQMGWVRACAAALVAVFGLGTMCAEVPSQRGAPPPWVTLKLKDLGVPPIPQSFLSVGSSMLTINLIDDEHLLLTFSTRGLVPREPDDPPDDDDRMVAAEVVELPSGKVLDKTEWHMHDHGRYLWALGKGRFLVRSRNRLFVITPGALLKTKQPLRARMFPDRPGLPVTARISPDSSLLMVESVLEGPKKPRTMGAAGVGSEEKIKPKVLIDFYRLRGGEGPEDAMTLQGAGSVLAPIALALPMDADGYLWPAEPTRGRWPVSFNEYGGKSVGVGEITSSCPPRLQMVSRFQYVAFACQGSEDKLKMEAFGMDGHENWEEPLGNSLGTPAFAFAPEAGRFAISRISTMTPDMGLGGNVVPEGATQEMRVYQTESGDLLLRVPTSPVTRSAETFDLSADGLIAAVVNAGVVQVYRLPRPTEKDMKELKEAANYAPPAADGAVELTRLAKKTEPATGDTTAVAEEAAGAKPAVTSGTAPAKSDTAAVAVTALGGAAAPSGPAVEGEESASDSGAAAGGQQDAGRPGSAAVAGTSKAAAGADSKGGVAAGEGDQTARRPPTLLQPGETAEYKGAAKKPE